MQGLQATFVLIIAVAAFLAGLCGERLRAKLARQAGKRGVGGERFPSRREQLLSLTQQSSFA